MLPIYSLRSASFFYPLIFQRIYQHPLLTLKGDWYRLLPKAYVKRVLNLPKNKGFETRKTPEIYR